ncbi:MULTISPECIES: hypothetical protein [unclassified Pseudomonas]|uniref:hypothetical protein n=1 Tax=unclassified Pseudomonas TaxID=196821 RepID=UPI000DA873C4|nr:MULTISPECIES: hypothetical protein [unclassified Pseudomonas]MDW3715642.1 hypothetical protein [Pseudomonas sp. 2023EL-01195]PZE10118.1 hypothetical protein DMX10_27730 [Pseudomonas sp. 57B-090624]
MDGFSMSLFGTGLSGLDRSKLQDMTHRLKLVRYGDGRPVPPQTSQPTATLQPNQAKPTPKVDQAAAQREAAYDEAFARLRVGLQSGSVEGGTSASGADTLTNDVYADAQSAAASVSKPAQSAAAQEFHDYMNKSAGEKMRDKILKELGLTEEEIDALPPEQQEQIEKQIAQRMAELAAIQQEEELRKRGVDLVSLDTEDPRLRAMLDPSTRAGMLGA